MSVRSVLLSNKLAKIFAVPAMIGILLAPEALAQDGQSSNGFYDSFKNGPFSADFSLGVEYDSNVSVIEIDASTSQSDFAFQFDFGLDVEADLGANTNVKLGYDFGQDIQFEISAFDTQSHRISTEISHNFGAVETGASYQYIHSKLGGAGFLRMHRFSPYAAGYVADKKVYMRGSYIYADKDFIGRVDRDSSANAGSVDAFYFINGQNTYLIAGYRFDSENAIASEFDHNSHNVKLRFIQRIPMGGRNGKLRLGWRYENRNYSSVTPSIGAIRDDKRQRVSASLEIPFSEIMFAEIEIRHDDFQSNLPSADFTQNLVTARIGGRL